MIQLTATTTATEATAGGPIQVPADTRFVCGSALCPAHGQYAPEAWELQLLADAGVEYQSPTCSRVETLARYFAHHLVPVR